MTTYVGVKVIAELIAAVGGVIFLSGLVLRGRTRDYAIVLGARSIGFAGLIILLECMFGFIDTNRISTAVLMLVFGTAVTPGLLDKRKKVDSETR